MIPTHLIHQGAGLPDVENLEDIDSTCAVCGCEISEGVPLKKVVSDAFTNWDVLEAIAEGVSEFGVVRLQGGDSEAAKQDAVDRFQNDPSVRIFLGSIRAAGVGITLTAASLLLFVELDWVPGIMTQAEDRIHRIGTAGSVLIQHLVYADSIDARMAEAIVDKQAIIEQALD